jgi:hypothetical protein
MAGIADGILQFDWRDVGDNEFLTAESGKEMHF